MDNRKAVADYAKALDELKSLEVVVGLPKGEADETVIQYGAVHEFGAPEKNIPRRSFLRAPTLNRENEIKRFMEQQSKGLERGDDPKIMLGKIGNYVKGIVLKAFRSNGDGQWQKLKESTEATKHKKAPKKPTKSKDKGVAILIDDGQLIGSITYEVRNASKS